MEKNADQSPQQPDKETRATFAGDATGAVGGGITPMIAPDKLQHEPQTPSAHEHDPGKPSHEVEDAGWVKEGQGSALAQEREGVPEGEIPHNLPESATQPRRKA
ncbi:MAG: hypothetical protein LC793_17590 [Thermomicrobia bacterium]|nr:hypothetical protein [Thermomicrobia bacterium]